MDTEKAFENMKKIRQNLYALLCFSDHTGKGGEINICYAAPTKKEVVKYEKESELDHCPCKHIIQKCVVEVKL